jgi:uncharacterized membrane protein SirB2
MQSIYNAIGYVFNPLPPRYFEYYLLLTVIIVVLLCFSVFMRVYIRKNNQDKTFRRLFREYPPKLETISVVIAICLLARYYGVAFISTRILLFAAILVMIYYVYKIVIVYLKKYPEQKRQHHELMKKNKYLPRKKNH